jgi:hypothetical protein
MRAIMTGSSPAASASEPSMVAEEMPVSPDKMIGPDPFRL